MSATEIRLLVQQQVAIKYVRVYLPPILISHFLTSSLGRAGRKTDRPFPIERWIGGLNHCNGALETQNMVELAALILRIFVSHGLSSKTMKTIMFSRCVESTHG